MGINGKVHDGAITQKWGEIKTQWFWLRLLLRAESRRERNEEQGRDEKPISMVSQPNLCVPDTVAHI